MAIQTPLQTETRPPESWPRQGEWTVRDWERLPSDDGWRYELILGALYMSPSPLTIHQRVLRELGYHMMSFTRGQGLGEVFFAPFDVHLPLRATVVEPDIVFVAADQAEIIGRRGVRVVPALLVEILSPSTKWVDLGAKRSAFAESGVPEYWIVDPVARTITVHMSASVDAEAADAGGGRAVEGGDFGAAWEYGVGDHARSRVIVGFGVHVDEVIPVE